jgi:anthranilate phosphoribosyltransferase
MTLPLTDTEALNLVIEQKELPHDTMVSLMRRIMGGEMSAPMMAALLVALRIKKETVGEIAAAALTPFT